ncbi:hypothetical protein CCY99_05470 [Helicobacter sp. 16-1353]|uniref:ComEC/Rec2 family competence protein n=1 Tax=Helicobacter sp. 16-1353 TaxID=2004996 RepID=UPI000DCF30AC|nr:ComEC/Rec2 family competence protein [Helicobacter sp. 16-1353]RAX53831.1 hypothetical protein CCY99_05470 [Helicobacter sp. 16-1353]
MKTIHSSLELDLINNTKDWIYFLIIILLIFIASISYEYYKYKNLTKEKNVNINAQVLLQYKKPDKNYFVLKLKSIDGEIFYTISRDDLRDIRGRFVRVYGILGKDCNFLQYLKSCFIISFDISLTNKKDYRSGVNEYIDSQHSDKYLYKSGEFEINLLGSLYKNIFLAHPMEPKLREVTASLGIAHVFAISGFHLGILTLALYIVFAPIYRILQKRYFSYRNEFYDLNFMILIIAFLYLIVLDFNPSFLRSFVMFAFGFFVLYSGIKLLSFKLLFICALFILALFPKIFFSIGFWLSVSGVFYIYLYLRHIPKIKNWQFVLLLNFIVFLNMLPIAHYFFYEFSLYQLLSPLIAIAFVVFYPLVLLLHIIGFGGILDEPLFAVINYDFFNVKLQTPFWFFIIFIVCSLMAMFSKRIYLLLLALSGIYFLYGVLLFVKDFL